MKPWTLFLIGAVYCCNIRAQSIVGISKPSPIQYYYMVGSGAQSINPRSLTNQKVLPFIDFRIAELREESVGVASFWKFRLGRLSQLSARFMRNVSEESGPGFHVGYEVDIASDPLKNSVDIIGIPAGFIHDAYTYFYIKPSVGGLWFSDKHVANGLDSRLRKHEGLQASLCANGGLTIFGPGKNSNVPTLAWQAGGAYTVATNQLRQPSATGVKIGKNRYFKANAGILFKISRTVMGEINVSQFHYLTTLHSPNEGSPIETQNVQISALCRMVEARLVFEVAEYFH